MYRASKGSCVALGDLDSTVHFLSLDFDKNRDKSEDCAESWYGSSRFLRSFEK